MRQTGGVELGCTDDLIEDERRVFDRLGERPVDRGGTVLPVIELFARHTPVRRLEPEATGEAGRNADRSAAVTRGHQRQYAGGHGRRRSAARSTRRELQI